MTTTGPYSLHGPDGDLGERADLHDALAFARAICHSRQVWVDVRDERGLSLGVAVPNNANATAIMARARKRNHEVSMGREEPKAPTLRTCRDGSEHDWIYSDRAPTRLYRCRMCDVIGYQHGGQVRPHACAECGVGATMAVEGKHHRARWLCEEHGAR